MEDVNKYSGIYKCLVIGTGPSSEPVIHHLSNTELNTLIVDCDDLCAKTNLQFSSNRENISGYTPKQKFHNLKRIRYNDTKNYH